MALPAFSAYSPALPQAVVDMATAPCPDWRIGNDEIFPEVSTFHTQFLSHVCSQPASLLAHATGSTCNSRQHVLRWLVTYASLRSSSSIMHPIVPTAAHFQSLARQNPPLQASDLLGTQADRGGLATQLLLSPAEPIALQP